MEPIHPRPRKRLAANPFAAKRSVAPHAAPVIVKPTGQPLQTEQTQPSYPTASARTAPQKQMPQAKPGLSKNITNPRENMHPKQSESRPGSPRRKWYILLGIFGLLLLAATTVLVLSGTNNDFDRQGFQFINHAWLPEWVNVQLAQPLSNAVYGIIGLVVVLLVVPKFRWLAWQYAVAGGAAFVATYVLEHTVSRPRPSGLEGYEAVLRDSIGGMGFPSTHVAVLAALCLTVWPFVSWPWRILLLLFVAAEAWSRIFLGVHTPLDVVGGLAVAALVVAIIHLLPQKIRRIFKLSA